VSFAALLVHPLAIVEPVYQVTDDDYGQPERDDPAVSLVRGMVQPKTAREIALTSQAGAELSDHVIFLQPRRIAAGAWIADADADGVLAGGRRFDITGVRSIEFGSAPHLEVDARLVGSTEGPTVGS
jgi:hypothetical protein